MKKILCKNEKVRKQTEQGSSFIHIPLALWIIVGCSFAFVLCMHTYNDILITAKQGYNLWNLLVEGNIFDFYKEARMTSGNEYYAVEQGAAYLFPVYLLFAVWNLPTWIISRILGFDCFNSIPSMIWMKLMLVVFVLISAKLVFKIITTIKGKEQYASLGTFLFISSILVIYPTALIGQYDIITVCFILLGIYAWCIKDSKKFIAFFAIALLFKYFAFLYFLPLLLIDEKRIRKLALKVLLVVLPIIPFLLFPKPKGQGSNVTSLIHIFLCGINIGDNTLYIFPFLVAIVLIVCFFKKTDSENRIHYAVFYIFLIMGSFCIIANPYPYWDVLAVPVFVLLVILSSNMNKSLLLEIAISLGITLKNYILYYWCFSMQTIKGMGILDTLLGKTDPTIGNNVSLMRHSFISSDLLNTWGFLMLLILFLTMIYFSHPRVKKNSIFEPFDMKTVYFRTGLNILTAIAPTVYLAGYLLFKG